MFDLRGRCVSAAALLATVLGFGTLRAEAPQCAPTFSRVVSVGSMGAFALGTWDFDRDGRPDLLMREGGFVKVYFNRGGAAFSPGPDLFAGDVLVGDFDNDGNLDILGTETGVPHPQVVFFRGDGRGGFREASSFRASGSLSHVVAGDFDGDGNLDIAGIAGGAWIWWYRGNGQGGFGLPFAFQPFIPYLSTLFSMDVDADGSAELLVGGSGFKTVILTAFTFAAKGSPQEVRGPDGGGFECGFDVAFGDVDGDGRTDAVTVNQGLGGCRDSIRTYLARPGSSLQIEQESLPLVRPVLADFDGDGWLDLAAFVAPQGPSSHPLALQLSDGNGRFGSPALFPMPYVEYLGGASLFAADFDGDGRADLVLSGAYRQSPLLFLNECGHRPAGPGSPLSSRPHVRTPGP